MQKVSKAYKESMKSSLRERAYIMLSFGLVNQEAQAKASIDDGAFAYFSNKSNVFGERSDDTIYATLEEDFTRVDGSMFFLPRQSSGRTYYDTGIISEKLLSQAACELIISLNTIAIDFKGLTINFGENYPVDFDIISSTGLLHYEESTEQTSYLLYPVRIWVGLLQRFSHGFITGQLCFPYRCRCAAD